jgi:DNA-binding beta-propeller fold protein YncE
VIDLLSETVLETIPTSGGGLGIGILPDDSKVYIAQSADGVDVLDTATNTLTNIAIPDDPYWITVSPDGSTVWAVLYGNNSGAVARISTSTDTVVATIQTPSAPNAYLSGITADGAKLYIFGYSPGTDLVNPVTDSVATAAWTAPGDPWDFQTCPFAAPPTPTSTTSTTTESNPVAPAFTG